MTNDQLRTGLALILITIAVLLLTSCATWDPPATGTGNWNRDLYDCEKDAAPMRDRLEAMGMKKRCMTQKGWRER